MSKNSHQLSACINRDRDRACIETLTYAFQIASAAERAGAGDALPVPAITVNTHDVLMVWTDYWRERRADLSIVRTVNPDTGEPVFTCNGTVWDNWRVCNATGHSAYTGYDRFYSNDPALLAEPIEKLYDWLQDNLRLDQLTPVPKDFGRALDIESIHLVSDAVPVFDRLLREARSRAMCAPLCVWYTADSVTYLPALKDQSTNTDMLSAVLLRWHNDEGETLLVRPTLNAEYVSEEDAPAWDWEWVLYRTDDPSDVLMESFVHEKPERALYDLMNARFPKAGLPRLPAGQY